MKKVIGSFAGWDQLLPEFKVTKLLCRPMQESCITFQRYQQNDA